MSFRAVKFFVFATLLFLSVLSIKAQLPDASNQNPASREDYPSGIKETFAKQRIKAEEKEFDEMIGRSEEVAKIAEEVYKSYDSSEKFSADDAKKMERVEKLVKKIRDELGSESADDKIQPPNTAPLSFKETLKNISDTSSDLLTALKKQGRFSISVVAIESSNTLLKLVRFVRQNQN